MMVVARRSANFRTRALVGAHNRALPGVLPTFRTRALVGALPAPRPVPWSTHAPAPCQRLARRLGQLTHPRPEHLPEEFWFSDFPKSRAAEGLLSYTGSDKGAKGG
jgi:hypothetical protein